MTTISIDTYIKTLNLGDNFLKLSKDEQTKALRASWKKFVRDNHPDLHGAEFTKKFQEGNKAYQELLTAIENGSIKYSSTFEKKKEYNSANTENDPFEEAIKEILKEFEEKEKRKEAERKAKLKECLYRGLCILGLLLFGAICILGLPLTLLLLANWFVGKLKLTC